MQEMELRIVEELVGSIINGWLAPTLTLSYIGSILVGIGGEVVYEELSNKGGLLISKIFGPTQELTKGGREVKESPPIGA